ncbi:MAG: Bpu10I family restriction endonuclease [Nitrospirae bacterium]|nr:Bpu10I family restriction endonuclease [Nitrospirota bacterium]MBF0591005.1 Bpu10I family restriction endonuclease [Nitrospirota bacterium]
MKDFPSPHGDKLLALLENQNLPIDDKTRVENAIERYNEWLKSLKSIKGTKENVIAQMLKLLSEYKLFIDIELIYDSTNNFLYRQKGQLKIDNTIIEEFLPIIINTLLKKSLNNLDISIGPATCFSGIRFESSLIHPQQGGGMKVREKDQDFAICRNLYIRSSYNSEFEKDITTKTNIAYIVAECKTNLDKTMFQEAAATALDVKMIVPSAKYFLLCEWLDMTPISSNTTAIDEIIILRKAKRISSNIRQDFNTYEKRQQQRDYFINYLKTNPFSEETFDRLISHIEGVIKDSNEDEILKRGYF